MEILELLKVVSGGGAVVALLAGIWVLYVIFDKVLTRFIEKIDRVEGRYFDSIEKLRETIEDLKGSIDDLGRRS